MGPRTATHDRTRSRLIALISVIIAIAFILLHAPAASAAAGDDQEKTPYYFAGNITFNDEPIADVVIGVEGNGFEATTTTDAEGKWRLYVPEKAAFTLIVDELSLPEGAIIDPELLPEGVAPVAGSSGKFEAEFGLTGTKIVNLFLGEGERITESIWEQILSRTVNGLNFGLLLGLASMGAALIYGTTRLGNFAHADMVTWGGLVAVLFTAFWNLPLWAGLIAAIIGGGLLGWALDAGLWAPLRRRGMSVVPTMIVSIGLALALRYIFQFIIGGGTIQLPGSSPAPWRLGPVTLSYIDVVTMTVSLVVILAVGFFLTRTRIGKATRAISDNPQLAAATGIDVDGVIRLVWILAGVLAAISGVLWAYFRPGVKWDMGVQMLLLIFCAMTIGGLGTAFGAIIGSLIVGIAVEVSTLWIPSDLKYASALVALIVILLVRPQGLLGRKERLG